MRIAFLTTWAISALSVIYACSCYRWTRLPGPGAAWTAGGWFAVACSVTALLGGAGRDSLHRVLPAAGMAVTAYLCLRGWAEDKEIRELQAEAQDRAEQP